MKKILFFVRGNAPTGADMKEAAKIDGQVLFRNVQLFDENQPIESCDGVAGAAPDVYVKKFNATPVKEVKEKIIISKEPE